MAKTVPNPDLDDALDDAEHQSDDDPGQADHADLVKRYKALQSKYNRLYSKAGTWKAAADERAQTENDELAKLEEEAIAFRTTEKTLKQQLEAANANLQRLTAENTAFVRAQSVRKALSNPDDDLSEVLPFFEAGFFNPGDAEGEAIAAKAKEFRTLLGTRFKQGLEKTLDGSKPVGNKPDPRATDGAAAGMTEDELRTWLYKNPMHEKYAEYEEAYFNLTSAK